MMITELLKDKDKYIESIKNNWLSCEDSFPDFLPEISDEIKKSNESYLNQMITDLQSQLRKSHRLPFTGKHWRNRSFRLLTTFLMKEDIINIHRYMGAAEIDRFIDELKQFLITLRNFSPELSFMEIGQAIRNYIVYAMFKKLHGDNSGFSPAAFGYSMLYPFTDNYIDSKSLSESEKKQYNQMICDKLEGKNPTPGSLYQKKTCDLLQMIEDTYPRNRYPYIFKLLLMMLDAQERSLLQQDKELMLTYQDRLDISIYKGGISVLMDRIFVNQELSEEDLLFYLSFGFFLQLADDLQDIKEDSGQGHGNIFTYDLSCSQEEKKVNRLFHYLHTVTSAYHADNDAFKEFLQKSSYLLIGTSVVRSREFFTKEYLIRLEKHLPVSISYLEELLSNRIEARESIIQKQYLLLLDELIK